MAAAGSALAFLGCGHREVRIQQDSGASAVRLRDVGFVGGAVGIGLHPLDRRIRLGGLYRRFDLRGGVAGKDLLRLPVGLVRAALAPGAVAVGGRAEDELPVESAAIAGMADAPMAPPPITAASMMPAVVLLIFAMVKLLCWGPGFRAGRGFGLYPASGAELWLHFRRAVPVL